MILRKQFKEKELKNKQLRLVLNRIPEDIYTKCLTSSINVNYINMPQNIKEKPVKSSQPNSHFEENINECFAANSSSVSDLRAASCDEANEKPDSSYGLVLNRIPDDVYKKCLRSSINMNHTAMQVSMPQNSKEKAVKNNQHNPTFGENMNECNAANSSSVSDSTRASCVKDNEKLDSSYRLVLNRIPYDIYKKCLTSSINVNHIPMQVSMPQNAEEEAVKNNQHNLRFGENMNECFATLKQQSCSSLPNKKHQLISKTKRNKFVEKKKLPSQSQSSRDSTQMNLQVVCERLPHDIYQIYSSHVSVPKSSLTENIGCNLENVQGAVSFDKVLTKQAKEVTVQKPGKIYKHSTDNKNTDQESDIRPVCNNFNKTFDDKKMTSKNPASDAKEDPLVTLFKCLQNEGRVLQSMSSSNVSDSNNERNEHADSAHFNGKKKKKKRFEKISSEKSKIHSKSRVKHKKSCKEDGTSVNLLEPNSDESNSHKLKWRKFKSLLRRESSEKNASEQGSRTLKNTLDTSAKTSQKKLEICSVSLQDKAESDVPQGSKHKNLKKNVKPKPAMSCKYCRKLARKNRLVEMKCVKRIKISNKKSHSHSIVPNLQNVVSREPYSFTENSSLNSQNFKPDVNEISDPSFTCQIEKLKDSVNKNTNFKYLKQKCRCSSLLKRKKTEAKKRDKALKEKKGFDKIASKILSSANVTPGIKSVNFNMHSKSNLKRNLDCEDFNKGSKNIKLLKTKSKKNCPELFKKLPLIDNTALELKNMSLVPLITPVKTLPGLQNLKPAQIKADKNASKNCNLNGRANALKESSKINHVRSKRSIKSLCNKNNTDKIRVQSDDSSLIQFCSPKKKLPLFSHNFKVGSTNSSNKNLKRPDKKKKDYSKSENSIKKCKTAELLKRKLENQMRKIKPKYIEQITKEETVCVTSQDIENITAVQFIFLLSHYKSLASYFTKILNKTFEKQSNKFQETDLKSKHLTNGCKCFNLLRKSFKLNKTNVVAKKKDGKNSSKTSLKLQNASTTRIDLHKTPISQKPTKNLSKLQNKLPKKDCQERKLKMKRIKRLKAKNKSKILRKNNLAVLKSDAKAAPQGSDLMKQDSSVDIQLKDPSNCQSKPKCKKFKGMLSKFSDKTVSLKNNKTKSHNSSIFKKNFPQKSSASKQMKFNLDASKDKGSFHPSSTSEDAAHANVFGIKTLKVVVEPQSAETNFRSLEKESCTFLAKPNEKKKNIAPRVSIQDNDSSVQTESLGSNSDKSVTKISDASISSNRDAGADLVETCTSNVCTVFPNNCKENVNNNIFIDSKSLDKNVKTETTAKTSLKAHNLWKYQLGFLQKNKLNRTRHALHLHNRKKVCFKTRVKEESKLAQ